MVLPQRFLFLPLSYGFPLLHSNALSTLCRRSVLITSVSCNGSTRPICTCVGLMPSDRSAHTSYVPAKHSRQTRAILSSSLFTRETTWPTLSSVLEFEFDFLVIITAARREVCDVVWAWRGHRQVPLRPHHGLHGPDRRWVFLDPRHLPKDRGSWSLTFPSDQQMYTASQYGFRSFPDIRRNSPSPTLKTEDAPTRWLNGEWSNPLDGSKGGLSQDGSRQVDFNWNC